MSHVIRKQISYPELKDMTTKLIDTAKQKDSIVVNCVVIDPRSFDDCVVGQTIAQQLNVPIVTVDEIKHQPRKYANVLCVCSILQHGTHHFIEDVFTKIVAMKCVVFIAAIFYMRNDYGFYPDYVAYELDKNKAYNIIFPYPQ